MPDDRRPDRLERTLEVLLYAPIGVGLWLKDVTPTLVQTFVARGRAEVDRRHEQVERRVRHARGMGEVAMAFGLPALRRRAEARIQDARQRVTGFLDDAAGTRREGETPAPSGPARAPADTANGAGPRPGADAGGPSPAAVASGPSAAELPITGYDALSASQVVPRLPGLSRDELDAVRVYEESTRRRRTILGKIDQLTS